MKKIIPLFIFLFALVHGLSAGTSVGEWTLFPSFYTVNNVVDTKNTVFALASGSLFSYSKADNSVETYTKLTNLNDNEISHIAYSPKTDKLLIVYSSGNMDILTADGIYNYPDLTDPDVQLKTVNSIYIKDQFAYLGTVFGIVVADLSKHVTKDTYKLGKNISSVCIKENEIYAACPDSIITNSLKKNLLDPNGWTKHPLNATSFSPADVKKILAFDGKLIYLVPKRGLYCENADKSITQILATSLVNGYENNGMLTVYSATTIYNFKNTTSEPEKIVYENISEVSSYNNGDLWVAGGESGLSKLTRQGVPSPPISIEGPKRNLAYYTTFINDELLIAGGGRWGDRYNLPGTFMIMRNGEDWYNYNEAKIMEKTGVRCSDFISIAVDPRDSKHYFVSSWGEGLYEFKGEEFINRYDFSNSTLESTSNNKINYVRVDGLCFDSKNNLWMTNSEVINGIKIFTANGEWKELYYPQLSKKYTVGSILITKKGHKWVILPRGESAVFVFDDKGNLDNTADHDSHYFTNFYDQDNKLVDVTNYYCAAEDKNGAVWVGTSRGPIVFSNPTRTLTDKNNRCARIKIPYEEGGTEAYFLLENDKVTAIAIDGANRKWLGTEASGIYLVNETGETIIENFTTKNSPLISDNISSISINDKTGDVYIGTNKGLVSYRNVATEGHDDYSDIYAYPNPVREDYTGTIVVTGLKENSFVKITDLNGNLIYQGKSLGGQIGWDGNNPDGKRVKSGIYLVLAIDEANKKEHAVTKIMVISK